MCKVHLLKVSYRFCNAQVSNLLKEYLQKNAIETSLNEYMSKYKLLCLN